MKNVLAKLAKSFFRYDLDAYFVFRDFLEHQAFSGADELSQSGRFWFALLDGSSDLKPLEELCVDGGYFGDDTNTVGHALFSQFTRGERCAGVFDDGRCVGMSWIAPADGNKWPSFAQIPGLGDRCGLVHMAYVRPAYRGNQLHRYLDVLRKHQLKREGKRTVVCFVGVKNFASIRSLMATNEEYRLVYHLTLDLALLPKFSLFLKRRSEDWESCRKYVERWTPELRVDRRSTGGHAGNE